MLSGGCVVDDSVIFPHHYFAFSQLSRCFHEKQWNTTKQIELVLHRLEHAANALLNAEVDSSTYILRKHQGEDTYDLVFYTLRDLGLLIKGERYDYKKTWRVAKPLLVKIQKSRFLIAAHRTAEISATDLEELAKFFDKMAELDYQFYEQNRPNRGCFG